MIALNIGFVIFIMIIFVLGIIYHWQRRIKNIANAKLSTTRMIAIIISAVIMFGVSYIYQNTLLSYLVASLATLLIFSMYASEGIGKEGFFTYSRRRFMGKLPFEKVKSIELTENSDVIILKIDDGLFIFEQTYPLKDKALIIEVLSKNKLLSASK